MASHFWPDGNPSCSPTLVSGVCFGSSGCSEADVWVKSSCARQPKADLAVMTMVATSAAVSSSTSSTGPRCTHGPILTVKASTGKLQDQGFIGLQCTAERMQRYCLQQITVTRREMSCPAAFRWLVLRCFHCALSSQTIIPMESDQQMQVICKPTSWMETMKTTIMKWP